MTLEFSRSQMLEQPTVEAEPQIRIIPQYPLEQLLPYDDARKSPLKDAVVDVISQPGSIDMMFPVVSASEYLRLIQTLAPYGGTLDGVLVDMQMISNSPGSRLSQAHFGMGDVWHEVVDSLPVKINAFADDQKFITMLRDSDKAKAAIHTHLERIADSAIPYIGPASFTEYRQALEGQAEAGEAVPLQRIMATLRMTRGEVGAFMRRNLPGMRDTSRARLTDEEIFRKYFTQTSYLSAVEYLFEAAQAKREDPYYHDPHKHIDINGNPYVLTEGGFSIRAAESEGGGAHIRYNGKRGISVDAVLAEQDGRLKLVRDNVDETVDGRVRFLEENRRMIAPVLRLDTSERGDAKFVGSGDFSSEAVRKIAEMFAARGERFDSAWLSPMAGKELLVVAQPGVRFLKNPWSQKVWHETVVAVSDIMGMPRRQILKKGKLVDEPTQTNGPLQASVTAHFDLQRNYHYYVPTLRNIQGLAQE